MLLIAVKLIFSDAPRAQDNLSKLLTVLSVIAAPSASALQNVWTFLVRVPALGAALGREHCEQSLIGYPERGERR